ncbi:MAG: FAD:protein FMN transferase [Tepidanaerobacteraceae bacterium]|jgi:thiamine biosynthesis lipoprotein
MSSWNLVKNAVMIAALLLITGCGGARVDEPLTRSNFMLDTIVQVTAYGDNASDVIDDVFERISEIESKMTAVGEDSEVIRINKAAGIKAQTVSSDTFYVIKRGLFYSNQSRGKFDITIGPLVRLWGIGTENVRVPSKSEIFNALENVNYRDVVLDENDNSVFLKNKGMSLDLGGIAKGYAADEAAEVLKKNGIKSAAIDLGGNICVIGKKPDGTMWNIGLQNPFEPRGSIFAIAAVADKTLVTSGVYERFFERDDKRYHHILDTATGYPVENDLVGVTIITDKSIDADALSTTMFSMGLSDGIKLVEKLQEVDAVFVTIDKKVYMSFEPDFYDFKLVSDDFQIMD